MSEEQRYNVPQVLRILHGLWALDGEEYSPLGKFADVRLSEWDDWAFVTAWWFQKQRAYLRLLHQLGELFGFHASEDEWLPLATGKTTMRQLAEFIAARAPYREIRPLRLLGRPCLEAGIFQELEQTTRQIVGRDIHVGPSTPLRQVLSNEQCGSLAFSLAFFFPNIHSAQNLWHRSRLDDAAMLSFTGMNLLAVLAGGLGCVGWLLAGNDGLSAFAAMPALLALLLSPVFFLAVFVAWLTGLGRGPLRKEIETYRDLVNVLKTEERRTAHA